MRATVSDSGACIYLPPVMSPEDSAMLQALYSRSAQSVTEHVARINPAASGKFMAQYYVGYGHKSIADCGSATLFIEDVSILAAKAIQDHPLYSGQETSTRYIDMSKRRLINPFNSAAGERIQAALMQFYSEMQQPLQAHLTALYPGEGETHERAIKARAFDISRGFLPAGVSTQLSWHSNLRQYGDHLMHLSAHPLPEVLSIAAAVRSILAAEYPHSGHGLSLPQVSGNSAHDGAAERTAWEKRVYADAAYPEKCAAPIAPADGRVIYRSTVQQDELQGYQGITQDRPRGCTLPHYMSDLGHVHFMFLLDYGCWRDIQRHRNGVCRAPLLTCNLGFEPWYLDRLPHDLRIRAEHLLQQQEIAIAALPPDPCLRQYYTPIGYRVNTHLTYGLPAAVYTVELRSTRFVHPILRNRMQQCAEHLRRAFPELALHTDNTPGEFDAARGAQTILSKA